MKKKTWNLYRCKALLWAKLEYEDALRFRKEKALQAKEYYRILGGRIKKYNGWTYGWTYENTIKMYNDSCDAADWNQQFIDEIEEERKVNVRN